VLAEACKRVISSDLYDRGFGDIGLDFLSAERSANNIITNPPYNCAEGFVRAGSSTPNVAVDVTDDLFHIASLGRVDEPTSSSVLKDSANCKVLREKTTLLLLHEGPRCGCTGDRQKATVEQSPALLSRSVSCCWTTQAQKVTLRSATSARCRSSVTIW
jgi:hypothetical protein